MLTYSPLEVNHVFINKHKRTKDAVLITFSHNHQDTDRTGAKMPKLPSSPNSTPHPRLGRVTPTEAYDLLTDPYMLFIDIRSEAEHFFVGSPPNVLNIPWLEMPDFQINPHFVQEVLRAAGTKSRPILLICRSGHRSIDAGNQLIAAGFEQVTHVLEGFEGDKNEAYQRSKRNGWRFRGLPWVQC